MLIAVNRAKRVIHNITHLWNPITDLPNGVCMYSFPLFYFVYSCLFKIVCKYFSLSTSYSGNYFYLLDIFCGENTHVFSSIWKYTYKMSSESKYIFYFHILKRTFWCSLLTSSVIIYLLLTLSVISYDVTCLSHVFS